MFKKIVIIALAISFIAFGSISAVAYDDARIFNLVESEHFLNLQTDYETYSSSVIGAMFGMVVGVYVAVAILPMIFNQTAVLERDAAGDLSDSEESLVSVWNIVIIAGFMGLLFGVAF